MHAERPTTSATDQTRELQRKLYLAAKRNRNRRFHALYDRIFRPDILWRAWEEVRRNGGSAGVDGVTIEDVEREGEEGFLGQIEQDLKARKYRPQPVRRVYIPKSSEPAKLRPLGIASIRDWVVQQACKIVIEPVFEANFQNNSYGFRPKRSAQQAVKVVREALVRGQYVVEADLQSYYDTIDHAMLMTLVQRRISDRRVLKLMRQWLKAGVLEAGERSASEIGSAQGGVISPLLANVYLHVLDICWTERYSSLGKLVRYADDFVIICQTQRDAQMALQKVEQITTLMKLTLHPTQTRIVELKQEGFDFLGFHFFHRSKSKTTHRFVPYMWPGQKAMDVVQKKLHAITERKQLYLTPQEIIQELNLIIRGWRNYFRIGNSTKKLEQLDRCVWHRMRRWARLRKGSRGHWNEQVFEALMNNSGLEHFYQRGICVNP